MSARLAKISVICAVGLLGQTFIVTQLGAAPFGASLDRRYDQNTFLATHNAYANAADGFNPALANQILGITQQLDGGVRCLLPDVWLMRQRVVSVAGLP